jgi:transcription elongation factor Elf1
VPEVTCPTCQTRQEVADAAGYTCVSCGSTWAFATCENCGVRFHMRPGTTAWTCPECGHENGSAEMVDLGADTEPQAEAEAFVEPEATPSPQAPPRRAAPAEPTAARSGPPSRGRLATIAVIGIVAVLVIAFALSALGGDGTDTAATETPGASSSAPAPSSSLTATKTLCLHLRDIQLLRVDNYTHLAGELANDAAAIQAEGDATLAAAVTKMRAAVLAYRDALAAQGDMTAATQQMSKADAAMPCG